MHDLDRVTKEFDYEDEYDLNSEWEYGAEEFGDEAEFEQDETFDTEYDYENRNAASALSEEDEMELASELLSIGNEKELDQFIGRLRQKAGARGRSGSPIWGKLGGFLKGLAKKALPLAGKVVGGMFGGPIGSKLGGKLGSFASNIFELELEGLSPEDQEFEVARQYVRFAAAATNNAAQTAANTPPTVAAKQAIHAAAKQHAPGLLKKPTNKVLRSGKWVRRGNKIIIQLY